MDVPQLMNTTEFSASTKGTGKVLLPHSAKTCVHSLSCAWLLATPWTVAYQASLSMGFSRQQYWSRLPFPSPRDLPNPGIESTSPSTPGLMSRFFYHWAPREAPFTEQICKEQQVAQVRMIPYLNTKWHTIFLHFILWFLNLLFCKFSLYELTFSPLHVSPLFVRKPFFNH